MPRSDLDSVFQGPRDSKKYSKNNAKLNEVLLLSNASGFSCFFLMFFLVDFFLYFFVFSCFQFVGSTEKADPLVDRI